MGRRGRKRVGGWLVVLIIAIGAIAAQSIQDHGYSNPNDFFEELLNTVISWSWIIILVLLVRWWFVRKNAEPSTKPPRRNVRE